MHRILSLLLIVGCSATPEDHDPHKEFNEGMLEFNLDLDRNVLKPVSTGYKEVVADPLQIMFSNFLDNIKEPFYLVNYTARGDGDNVVTSIFRFVINSTFGILGLFDVATELGLGKHSTGYKDTMKKLEVPHGDYIVLPIFGTSSTRDAIAEPVSWFADPANYFLGWPLSITKAVFQMIVDRAENSELIDDTINNSEDIYQTTRSMYLQKYGVGYDVPSEDEGPAPDFDDDDNENSSPDEAKK